MTLESIGGVTARNMVQLRDLEDLAINRYMRPPLAELVIPLTVLCEVEIHPYTALKAPGYSWFLYWMVALFTMRIHGVIQAFRFVEYVWLHRKSRQIRFFWGEKTLFTSYMRNVK